MKFTIPYFLILLLVFSCNTKNQEQTDHFGSENQEVFIKTIDAVTFKNLMESGKGIVLDVRTKGEVAQGVIPETLIIDIYDPEFSEKIKSLPKDKEVYVYCTSGVRSMMAAKILQRDGFDRVYNLRGGIIEWQTNRFPIERPVR
ncbi:rhodanese-like domain-containing protein [Aquiflexum lacus]|uniref:rhodanese-like domain-containing protein n=1 Tax=Aquiflexum lacus TaxID=2483805 RepID=UPI001E312431|nr:rhodanese-like domain-containing protein [Aquiflexum lacus]